MIYLLLALYPRDWRRRYALEVLAHYGEQRLGWRGTFDLLGGALDAHLHPQWPGRGTRWAAFALMVAALALAQFLLPLLQSVIFGTRDLRWSPVLAIGDVVVWTLVFAVPARRRWPRPVGVVVGLAMELLLASSFSPILLLGWRAHLLGIVAWAVVLAAVIASPPRPPRRRPWRPDDPAAGARLPRRPYDPDPEPLEAIGQLRR